MPRSSSPVAAGNVYGRWTVLFKREVRGKHGQVFWRCLCSCGTEKEVSATTLARGDSRSCGCLSADLSRKHGMEGTPTYNAWGHMRDRCGNERHAQWGQYGGRGISVCSAWHSFGQFFADMGEKPPGRSLDRIDNDGNYEPGNCRWATAGEQVRNRRTSVLVEWQGRVQSLAELARAHGLPWRRAYERHRAGWTLDSVLLKPVAPRKCNYPTATRS